MDIPNLSSTPVSNPNNSSKINLIILGVILVVGTVSGFWISRFAPKSATNSSGLPLIGNNKPASADNISSADQLETGKVYGNSDAKFKDTASGTIEKGSINGEGTHILNREGGSTQRASLISSAVDLDLFVGKKVEIKGETNASTKTSWLLDVGNIKIIE